MGGWTQLEVDIVTLHDRKCIVDAGVVQLRSKSADMQVGRLLATMDLERVSKRERERERERETEREAETRRGASERARSCRRQSRRRVGRAVLQRSTRFSQRTRTLVHRLHPRGIRHGFDEFASRRDRTGPSSLEYFSTSLVLGIFLAVHRHPCDSSRAFNDLSPFLALAPRINSARSNSRGPATATRNRAFSDPSCCSWKPAASVQFR